MFDRLRELRPAAGTEELRTILNRAGGDFNAALASLGADTPAAPPTNQATVRTVEQVRADRLLGVESARRHPGAVAPAAVARGPSNLRPENLRVALGLDVMSTQPQYDDAAYLARVASAAPTAPVPTTVVMGGPVTDATPEVIPAARVATDTDAPPPYAVVVGRALSGTGPATMM